jgi:hypothetical protein
MVRQIIEAVIVALVLYVIYMVLALVVPAQFMFIIGILLVLAFCLYLLRAFGISL